MSVRRIVAPDGCYARHPRINKIRAFIDSRKGWCFEMNDIQSICMATKGGDNIVLTSLDDQTYIKEIYDGFDLKASLKSSKIVEGPFTRDGVIFADVYSLFQFLMLNSGYKQYDVQLYAS